MTYEPQQGDIVWLDFPFSVEEQSRSAYLAAVISSNAYNRKTSYIIVCPITTSQGDRFLGYIDLANYAVEGKINATQVYSFSLKRLKSFEFVDRLRGEDFLLVKQVLDYAMVVDF